jgi:diguanylate cyclase (GGDEF)-like protein
MDWNTLPDLLALSALVAVFASLLPRKPDSDLRLWLVGWALIVLHFGAKMSDASGENVVASIITLGSLQLAGLSFMWAAVSRRVTPDGFLGFCSLAVPQLAYMVLGVFNVNSNGLYLAVAVAIVIVPVIVLGRVIRTSAADRLLAALACLLLGVSLLVIIRFDSDPSDGINNILTWLYLGAAILFWRRFRRTTAGVLTLVFGFIAWGLVFPIGAALDTWAPHVHIDDAAYNIPKYIVAIGIILSLLEEQMERSTYLSLHDDLTGLPNRRLFEDRLVSALARARRTGTRLAMLSIDLDHFKVVNDSFGHHAGDEFLRVVAQRFAKRIRSTDTCARLGGDEFIVIADQVANRDDAEDLARDLLATLAEPIRLRGEDVTAFASIGIALFPDDGEDAESLRTASDGALYVMKRKNRRVERLANDTRAAG